MIDLSYTNKDGLNPAEGFENIFNYHKDAASSGQGYANGGYPEITGETSDLYGLNYKTGDVLDHWGNGNTFDIITGGGGGGGNVFTATGVFKRAWCSPYSGGLEDITISFSYPQEEIYNTYTNQTFYEWKTGRYILGNTDLLAGWSNYDGPSMHTDWDFCLLLGFDYGSQIDIINKPEYYNKRYKLVVDENEVVSYKIGNYQWQIYTNWLDAFCCDAISETEVTEEQYEILESHVGENIGVTIGEEKVSGELEDWSEDYEVKHLGVYDEGVLDLAIAQDYLEKGSTDDKIYVAIGPAYPGVSGITTVDGDIFTASIDFDNLEPTA